MKYLLYLLMLSITLLAGQEKVTLELSWKHQFQFAGFYVAKEMGYYRDVGLDVEIIEYEYGKGVVEDVLNNRATYGIGKSSLLISKNRNKPIVMLGAIFQNSPSVLITTNPDIKKPSDLAAKEIMITKNEVQSASITTMLLSNGISKEELKIVPHSFNYKDLLNKKTDAMACYISNEPYFLEKSHIPYRVFDPKDYGFDFYGDILFTSEDEMKNHQQRVRRFYEATHKGWIYAFSHIDKSAKLIFEKYNTQKKSLESLIYEAKIIKKLALVKNIPFGHLSKTKFKEIAKVYQLAGLLEGECSLEGWIDPLNFNKKNVKIGILAKRGSEGTVERWKILSEYLNSKFEIYNFTIVPLAFIEIEKSVAQKEIDFLITNPLSYVQLENKFGISRIATLLSEGDGKMSLLNKFGGVIFTQADNKNINRLDDVKGLLFGVVNENSLGGWAVGYEQLIDNGIKKSEIDIEYLNTHDAVVKSVMAKKVDVGIVRTDTLERMQKEKKIELSDFKVINRLEYDGFPYLVSTKLYPEWPFSKLNHTDEHLSNKIVSVLLAIDIDENPELQKVGDWTVPLNYLTIHSLLKKLKIAPYNTIEITLIDIFEKYTLEIYILSFFILFLFFKIFYNFRVSRYLRSYNKQLKNSVEIRTKELKEANEKLKVLANNDFLTGISSRGYFEKIAGKYFEMAKRNNTMLQVLSIDLDYFKKINDTYGHKAGDEVLKETTKTIASYLRTSDIFGRIGGEEFSIVLQNTSLDGALLF